MRIIINHSSMIPIYEHNCWSNKKTNQWPYSSRKWSFTFCSLTFKRIKNKCIYCKKEGLTKTIHGKGTFVLAVNKDLLEEAKKEIEEYLEKALQKAKQSGVSHKEVKELLELLMEE